MFNYIIIFGSAALTYILVNTLLDKKMNNAFNAFIELLVYAMIDMVTVYLILSPFGVVDVVVSASGMRELQYGNIAILCSIVVSIVWSGIISVIRRNIAIKIDIE